MTDITARRRSVLSAAGAAALSASALPILASCDTGPRKTNTVSSDAVELPQYIRYEGITPELPGTADGLQDGFLSYPSSPVRATTEAPGDGGKVTALVELAVAPPAVDRNAYWQELNKRLAVDLQINGAPAASYSQKFATTLASGDLPDYVQIKPVPRLPEVLASQFQDLADFVAGTEIKQYPFLANLPTQAWRNTVFNGGIYGIPFPTPLVTGYLFSRRDILRSRGLDDQITSGEELLALMRALTEPAKNKWACSTPMAVLDFIDQMMGAPNVWREENGKFVHNYETDEHKRALAVVAGMWKEGLFHPDSFGGGAAAETWFGTGITPLYFASFASWPRFYDTYGGSEKTLDVGTVAIPRYDGGGVAGKFLSKGYYSFAALKKASPDRIRQLLRIMNWLATPFGTEEHLFRVYGIDGVHYQRTQGDVQIIEDRALQVKVPAYYIAKEPPVLYTAGKPQVTREQYETNKRLIPTGVRDASLGLVSETDVTIKARLVKTMTDTTSDILQGRKSVADWDEAVRTWRTAGGDTIRQEYERAFAESR